MVMLGVIAYKIKEINPVVRVEQITIPNKSKENQKKEALETQHLEEKLKEIQKKKPPSKYGEEWKPLVEPLPVKTVPIQKDRYLVSSMGRIWDKEKEELVETHVDGIACKAYLRNEKGGSTLRLVKVLVATTFIGVQNTMNFKVVNNDGNPRNCAKTNLRWERTKKGPRSKTVWTTGGYR